MRQLTDIPLEELYECLGMIENSVPVQRVLAVIAYKKGETIQQIADRHNVSEQTIRNWISRFERKRLQSAPFDGQRSGRPPKISEAAKEELWQALNHPPEACGYEHTDWSPALVADYLAKSHGIKYSERHSRRLFDEFFQGSQ